MTSSAGNGRSDGFGAQVTAWTRYWSRLADPARLAVADAAGVGAGTEVLDVGCGSGEFARLAADRGAVVSGIDAAPEMIEVATTTAPGARFRVGDMTDLPWPADSFDVVTAVNAFQFADDPVVPLLEAARVVRVDGVVAICNWGPWQQQDNSVITDALKTLLPEPPPPRTTTVSPPGALEALVERAGLRVRHAADVDVPWEVPDVATLLAAVQFNVDRIDIARHADADTIAATIRAAAEPFRRPDGSYRFHNRWRYVVAR